MSGGGGRCCTGTAVSRVGHWEHARGAGDMRRRCFRGGGCREEHPADTSLGPPLYFWDFEAHKHTCLPAPGPGCFRSRSPGPCSAKQGTDEGMYVAHSGLSQPGVTQDLPASPAGHLPPQPTSPRRLLQLACGSSRGRLPSKSDSDPTSEVSTLDPHPPAKAHRRVYTHTLATDGHRRPRTATSHQFSTTWGQCASPDYHPQAWPQLTKITGSWGDATYLTSPHLGFAETQVTRWKQVTRRL